MGETAFHRADHTTWLSNGHPENIHISNIIWTKQTIFIYLGIPTHMHIHTHTIKKKRRHKFEREQVVGNMRGLEGGKKGRNNVIIL